MVDGVQPGPVVALRRPEARLVVVPRRVEVDLPVHTALDHRVTSVDAMLTVNLLERRKGEFVMVSKLYWQPQD